MRTRRHDATAIGAILAGAIGSGAVAALLITSFAGSRESSEAIWPNAIPTSVSEVPGSSAESSGVADAPVFIPFDVAPDLMNRAEIQQALLDEYPAALQDAGIGGTAGVFVFVDEEGVAQTTLIRTSTGHEALDQAALRIANTMRFRPALNRDKRVAVWVDLPIIFQVR